MQRLTRNAGIIGLASTLYNNFLPYLCVFRHHIIGVCLIPRRLSSRGAVFGDGSLFITYRNVSATTYLCSTADARRPIASHLERYRCPRCLDCWLGGRAPVYRA
jgi:hypothetical protein